MQFPLQAESTKIMVKEFCVVPWIGNAKAIAKVGK